jgi:hypothetical protein
MATPTAWVGSCPTAPPLASPRRVVAQSQPKNTKSRRSKRPRLDRASTYVPPTWQNGSRCRFAPSQAHLSSWPNPHSTRGTVAAHIPRFRALALFGRRPLSAGIVPPSRHPKTLYGAYWCQVESVGAVESFCHVTRLHLRHGQPLARLCRAVKPQNRLRRAEGAGLDGECAVRAIIIVAATTYKGHSALFEALCAIVGPLLSPT